MTDTLPNTLFPGRANYTGPAAMQEEITRLRAELHTMSHRAGNLLAVIYRLREALELIKELTFLDAEGPELRAQNECNHRRASEALAVGWGAAEET